MGSYFGWTLIRADFQTLIIADYLRSSALRSICGNPRAISLHFISGGQVPKERLIIPPGSGERPILDGRGLALIFRR